MKDHDETLEYSSLTTDDIDRLVARGRRMRSEYISQQGSKLREMFRKLQGRRAEVRVVWRPQMS